MMTPGLPWQVMDGTQGQTTGWNDGDCVPRTLVVGPAHQICTPRVPPAHTCRRFSSTPSPRPHTRSCQRRPAAVAARSQKPNDGGQQPDAGPPALRAYWEDVVRHGAAGIEPAAGESLACHAVSSPCAHVYCRFCPAPRLMYSLSAPRLHCCALRWRAQRRTYTFWASRATCGMPKASVGRDCVVDGTAGPLLICVYP